MHQNFLQLHTVRLAYTEVNSEKINTIFFIHGNSGSSRTWEKQLQDHRFSNYRLVAIDLPGNGLSGEPEDLNKGYSLPQMGQVVAEAIIQLAGTAPYVVTGFSLGTNIIGEMMAYGIHPQGIALISPCILRTAEDLPSIFLPNPKAAYFFTDVVTIEEVNLLSQDCFYRQNDDVITIFREDFLNTRTPFRSMLMKTSSAGAYVNEIKMLSDYNNPMLVVFGKEDRIVNVHYLDTIQLPLWKGSIFKTDNGGHFTHIDAAEYINTLLSEYTEKVFKPVHALQQN